MRPRFERTSSLAADEVLLGVKESLADAAPVVQGRVVGRHVHLSMGESVRSYWSPHLWVDVHPAQSGCMVRGLFGPHPSIWTMFMAAYAVIGFSALVGIAFGYSQWSLGQSPQALWSLPGAVLATTCVYLLALHGQRLSRRQMNRLLEVVETAMGVPS
jgi:hypothetical protein